VAQSVAHGQISPQQAQRIEADLTAVPDSFFAQLRDLMPGFRS
jgi:hypothetical protein